MLVSRINIMANERDIYTYFAKAGVGKIRDVRLIRDQRSGKSKGYVVSQNLSELGQKLSISLSFIFVDYSRFLDCILI